MLHAWQDSPVMENHSPASFQPMNPWSLSWGGDQRLVLASRPVPRNLVPDNFVQSYVPCANPTDRRTRWHELAPFRGRPYKYELPKNQSKVYMGVTTFIFTSINNHQQSPPHQNTTWYPTDARRRERDCQHSPCPDAMQAHHYARSKKPNLLGEVCVPRSQFSQSTAMARIIKCDQGVRQGSRNETSDHLSIIQNVRSSDYAQQRKLRTQRTALHNLKEL